MNRTLLQMLRTLQESEKHKWHTKINKMTFVYNATQRTGYSPYFLLFGMEPKLPLDNVLEYDDKPGQKSHSQYVKEWKKEMEEAYQIASRKSNKRKISDQ